MRYLTTLLPVLALTVAGAMSEPRVERTEEASLVPKQYPQIGDIWYDGYSYWDSYFQWSEPGNWHVTRPGVELDIALFSKYYDTCTAWSDLPDPYSDCPTAGTAEPGETVQFGIGTYAARSVVAWYEYHAEWQFSGGSSASSDFKLTWQETQNYCGWNSPWCMIGACDPGCGGYLVSDIIRYTYTLYRSWNY